MVSRLLFYLIELYLTLDVVFLIFDREAASFLDPARPKKGATKLIGCISGLNDGAILKLKFSFALVSDG